MADVRAVVGFGESLEGIYTFSKNGTIVYTSSYYDGTNHSAQVGMAVELVSDSTVGLGTTGHWPLGKLTRVESDGFVSVATRGVLALPYNSGNANPPLVGRGVQVDGAGLVITPAGGARLATERGTVLSLDATNSLAYVQF